MKKKLTEEQKKEQKAADAYVWDETDFIKLADHKKGEVKTLARRINDLEQHVISKLDLVLQRLEKLEKDGLYYKDKNGSMRPITTEELYEFYNRSGREL